MVFPLNMLKKKNRNPEKQSVALHLISLRSPRTAGACAVKLLAVKKRLWIKFLVSVSSQVAHGCGEGLSPSLQGDGGKKQHLDGCMAGMYWVSVPRTEDWRVFVTGGDTRGLGEGRMSQLHAGKHTSISPALPQ